MRKTIYVKDEGLWADLKVKAEAVGISVSEYLMRGISGKVEPVEKFEGFKEQLDRMEGKVDSLLVDFANAMIEGHAAVQNTSPVSEDMPIDPPVRKESSIKAQAAGQAEYDSNREGRDIKQDKIAKVRQKVESLTKFSGAYSKEHQTRKKGK